MERKKIGFDFDGVIADTDKIKKEFFCSQGIWLKKFNKSDIYKEMKNKYSLEEIELIYGNMSKYVFNESKTEEILPIENAIESIKILSEKFDIYIITARNYKQLLWVENWLYKYDINKNIKKIISSSEEKKYKLQICKENGIIFFCDDDVRHLEYAEEKEIVKLLFNNENLSQNNEIHTVVSWNELMNLMKIYGSINGE